MKKILFLDRDGTLIEEPKDLQVDALSKLRLLPHVISSLTELTKIGFELVMVSNQDGLGTQAYLEKDFLEVQGFLLELLKTENIIFKKCFIDTHFASDNHPNRKPSLGMLKDFLAKNDIDMQASFVIGDRPTDVLLAKNIGCRSVSLVKKGNKSKLFKDELPSLSSWKGVENDTLFFETWKQSVKQLLKGE